MVLEHFLAFTNVSFTLGSDKANSPDISEKIGYPKCSTKCNGTVQCILESKKYGTSLFMVQAGSGSNSSLHIVLFSFTWFPFPPHRQFSFQIVLLPSTSFPTSPHRLLPFQIRDVADTDFFISVDADLWMHIRMSKSMQIRFCTIVYLVFGT